MSISPKLCTAISLEKKAKVKNKKKENCPNFIGNHENTIQATIKFKVYPCQIGKEIKSDEVLSVKENVKQNEHFYPGIMYTIFRVLLSQLCFCRCDNVPQRKRLGGERLYLAQESRLQPTTVAQLDQQWLSTNKRSKIQQLFSPQG